LNIFKFLPDPLQNKYTIAGEEFSINDGILGMAITRKINKQFKEPHLIFHSLASNTENAVKLRVINDREMFEVNVNANPQEFFVIGSRGKDVQTSGEILIQFLILSNRILQCKQWIRMEIYFSCSGTRQWLFAGILQRLTEETILWFFT
jgi:Major royal jelly protein